MSKAAKTKLSKLTDFLDRLDAADVHYNVSSVREAAVMVGATVPGHRFEVEFMANGEVEVEIFKSDGQILDLDATAELFKLAAESQS